MTQDAGGFTRMDDSSPQEWAGIATSFRQDCAAVSGHVLALFRGLSAAKISFRLGPDAHGLQTATRALRNGADEETVVVALLHDLGDVLAPANHAEFAAAMLRPYISAENHWMLLHHEVFQTRHYFGRIGLDPTVSDRFLGHPAYEKTARFCEVWDQVSFDPGYDTLPLEAFEPMVHRLFARPLYEDGRAVMAVDAAGLVINMTPNASLP